MMGLIDNLKEKIKDSGFQKIIVKSKDFIDACCKRRFKREKEDDYDFF